MPTLASHFHALSPYIYRISGDFGIRWYGAAYLAGFLAAFLILRWLAKRNLILIPLDRIPDAMLWLIGGTLLGGRLGYALFYDPTFHLLLGFSKSFPFWNFLAINQGGMASHGALIGVIAACYRVSRGWQDLGLGTPTLRVGSPGTPTLRGGVGRAPFLHITDCAAFVAPIGIGFGRIANFINGELLGRIVTPPGVEGPWWSVQYPQELEWYLQNKGEPFPRPNPDRLQQTPEQWSQLLDLARTAAPGEKLAFGLDALANSHGKYAAQLKPLISSRHPTQFYQAFAEGILIGAILWIVWAKPRKPGVIGAWFLIVYGAGRIATETVRLPDVQVGTHAGLSMGQWLSIGMIALGIIVALIARKHPSPKLGGWLKT